MADGQERRAAHFSRLHWAVMSAFIAMTALAARQVGTDFQAFTGRFARGERYDESRYARELAEVEGFRLHETTVGPDDFVENIRNTRQIADVYLDGARLAREAWLAAWRRK